MSETIFNFYGSSGLSIPLTENFFGLGNKASAQWNYQLPTYYVCTMYFKCRYSLGNIREAAKEHVQTILYLQGCHYSDRKMHGKIQTTEG